MNPCELLSERFGPPVLPSFSSSLLSWLEDACVMKLSLTSDSVLPISNVSCIIYMYIDILALSHCLPDSTDTSLLHTCSGCFILNGRLLTPHFHFNRLPSWRQVLANNLFWSLELRHSRHSRCSLLSPSPPPCAHLSVPSARPLPPWHAQSPLSAPHATWLASKGLPDLRACIFHQKSHHLMPTLRDDVRIALLAA
jgi:hypothetical protein